VISGREVGGQLGPVGRLCQGGRCLTGILEGMVLDLTSVVTVVRAVDVH
jgi:hypothetical protein